MEFLFPFVKHFGGPLSTPIICGTPWEIPQKVLDFFDSQKIFFQMVNHHIPQLEFPRNSLDGNNISLKIKITYFMLIRHSNKFWTIPIVRGPWTSDIPQQLMNLKITVGINWRIENMQHWMATQDRIFWVPYAYYRALSKHLFQKVPSLKVEFVS